MNPRIQERRDNAIEPLEDPHRLFFTPRDEYLDRIVTIHRERRRILQDLIIETVVTYGAYEDPI